MGHPPNPYSAELPFQNKRGYRRLFSNSDRAIIRRFAEVLFGGNILQILAFARVAENGTIQHLPCPQPLSRVFERHVNCSDAPEMQETRSSRRVPLTTQAR